MHFIIVRLLAAPAIISFSKKSGQTYKHTHKHTNTQTHKQVLGQKTPHNKGLKGPRLNTSWE